MQMRIQGVRVFPVIQEISQGFPIPYQESLNPSSIRKLQVKDEQTLLYKKEHEFHMKRRSRKHIVDA